MPILLIKSKLSNCPLFRKMWFEIVFFQRWNSEGKQQPIVRKVSLHFISSRSSVHLQRESNEFNESRLSDHKDPCMAQACLASFQATKRSGQFKLSYNLDQTLLRPRSFQSIRHSRPPNLVCQIGALLYAWRGSAVVFSFLAASNLSNSIKLAWLCSGLAFSYPLQPNSLRTTP